MTFDDASVDDRQRHIAAGMARLEAISARFDAEQLKAIAQMPHARRVAAQPWLVAGVSDGMGLHTTLAAIDAGILRRGVGVYYEPEALLGVDAAQNPVSPVHYARLQNALALQEYARQRDVVFEVIFADMILAPRRGLKGDIKEPAPDFSEVVARAFERAREQTPGKDAIFVDSVAFGKWISPREGAAPVEAPSIDFEGRIIATHTKGFHPRGYQETLDTMGRNHIRLVDAMVQRGWLGAGALTAFFTWAGGSQNVHALQGVYGRGALGDAKIIAESDIAAFRLQHGLDHGVHAIVRLPAFLSAALMAIPGAGLFGLISQHVLSARGVYWDMPTLAQKMLSQLFGLAWIHENPLSQIELDTAEILYMDEISAAVDAAHQRIAEYRAGQPEEARQRPIPLTESQRLLDGLVPPNYPEILAKFRPDLGE